MLKHKTLRLVRACFEGCGLTISRRSDYYSPLPSEFELCKTRARWVKPSALKAVAFDLNDMKSRLHGLRDGYYDEFLTLPSYVSLCNAGYGPGFTHVDAFVLYALMRRLKPSRYIEVGSGLSTYYANLARGRNREEGRDTQILCIEPYPFPKLREIGQIDLIQSEVQDVQLGTFQSLREGDVLFIDSSHVILPDGDVPYLLLEVLPDLAKGVYIHIHDIPFPFNVPFPPITGRSCRIRSHPTGRCFGTSPCCFRRFWRSIHRSRSGFRAQ
jgi:hypothetical protein